MQVESACRIALESGLTETRLQASPAQESLSYRPSLSKDPVLVLSMLKQEGLVEGQHLDPLISLSWYSESSDKKQLSAWARDCLGVKPNCIPGSDLG